MPKRLKCTIVGSQFMKIIQQTTFNTQCSAFFLLIKGSIIELEFGYPVTYVCSSFFLSAILQLVIGHSWLKLTDYCEYKSRVHCSRGRHETISVMA